MNSSFIHADIFFYITTIAIVILTTLLVILFYYIIKIVISLEQTASSIREESERVIEDISSVRESIEEHGGRVANLVKFVFSSLARGGNSKNSENTERSKSRKVTKGDKDRGSKRAE